MLPESTAAPGAFGCRPALSRDHGLVDIGRAFDDDAVHGDALSWPDQHQRTDGHLPRRNAHLGAAVHHRHAFLLRRKHRRQIAHRTGAPQGLEITAEGEQDQEHGGGVEVDFGAAHHDGQRGIRIGHSGTKRDQGGRSQAAVGRGAPGLLEQRPAQDQQHGRCQRPQNQVDHLADLGIRLLERARIQQQAEEHDVHGQERANSQPDQQPRGFGLLAFAAARPGRRGSSHSSRSDGPRPGPGARGRALGSAAGSGCKERACVAAALIARADARPSERPRARR